MMVRLTTEQEANVRNSLELSNELKMRSGEFFSVEDVHSLLCEITALREESKQMCDVDNRHCIDEITSVYTERDYLEKLNNDSVTEFCQKIAASEAREVVLRGALEKIERAYPLNGDRMAHQDYAKKVLSFTSPPPLLTGLQIAKEALEGVIAVADRKTKEFDKARDALTQLKELGL